ncbi:hypothetical protein K474DRAFT_1607015, partial [Panus rudis PR-1116 ss-1]
RCFPHVGNISSQAGLTALPDVDMLRQLCAERGRVLSDEDQQYIEVLASDVVARSRNTVNTCRSGTLRREKFEDAIKKANERAAFGREPSPTANPDDGKPIQKPTMDLLRDVETRWSSTYSMLDRLLEFRPAVSILLRELEHLAAHDFDKLGWHVVDDVREFLKVHHRVHAVVNFEKTVSICVVIPVYEKLLSLLKKLEEATPLLIHAIKASMDKLEEYLNIERKKPIYSIAVGMYNVRSAMAMVLMMMSPAYQPLTLLTNSIGSERIGPHKRPFAPRNGLPTS